MSFEILVRVAVKATRVSDHFAVHLALDASGAYCLTHIPTGYIACQSKKQNFLAGVADVIEKRCPPLNSDCAAVVTELIPPSLRKYLNYINGGGFATYFEFCSEQKLEPAPEVVDRRTSLQKLLDTEF